MNEDIIYKPHDRATSHLQSPIIHRENISHKKYSSMKKR